MKQPLFILLSFLLVSCGQKASDSQVVEVKEIQFPQVVPFETGIETEKEVLLSQIAESVEYIPLETKDNCLIKGLKSGRVFKTEKYWIVSWVTTLYQFTADGKFVRTFGRKGGGPGEYNWVHDVDVDEAKDRVYLMDTNGKIYVYELETGKYCYDIKIPSYEANSFAMLTDSIVSTFLPNSNGMQKERMYLSGLKGDTLNTFYRNDFFDVKPGMRYSMSWPTDRYMFRYDGKVCYKEYNNDTVFVVTEKELQPRYIIQLGQYHLPSEKRMEACDGDMKKFRSLAAPYLRNQTIETEPYLFMPYTSWAPENDKSQLALYDKAEKLCYAVAGGEIKNDMSGGLPFVPTTSIDKQTLVSVWYVDDIYKEAEKNSKVFENAILKSLNEDDNPVLMIVHLK